MKYGKNYAYTVIMVIAAITVLFGFMIPKIDMDNELRHFFPEKHPSNIRFKQLTADFGDQSFAQTMLPPSKIFPKSLL